MCDELLAYVHRHQYFFGRLLILNIGFPLSVKKLNHSEHPYRQEGLLIHVSYSARSLVPGSSSLFFLDLPILLFCAAVSATLFAERVS